MAVKTFRLKTIGYSKVYFEFGDIFEKDCFVLTTNVYFDVDPSSDYIAENSLLGKYVKKYYKDNVEKLECLISEELRQNSFNLSNETYSYGTCIRITSHEKLIYFLAFTDRNKFEQPADFYQQTVKKFMKKIAEENHGKEIAIPLIGANNHLSDSGFSDEEMALRSLMAMVNDFEITCPRSELRLRIVTLEKHRKKLIQALRQLRG